MQVTQSSRGGKLSQSFTDGQGIRAILILTSEHICVVNPCTQVLRMIRIKKCKIIPKLILIKDFDREGKKPLYAFKNRTNFILKGNIYL